MSCSDITLQKATQDQLVVLACWEIKVPMNSAGVRFQFARCVFFPLLYTSREYFRWCLLGWRDYCNWFLWLLPKMWMYILSYIFKILPSIKIFRWMEVEITESLGTNISYQLFITSLWSILFLSAWWLDHEVPLMKGPEMQSLREGILKEEKM